MPDAQDFTIREVVTYRVEAESGQEALERFLQAEDTNEFFEAVHEREVEDAIGNPVEVTDP